MNILIVTEDSTYRLNLRNHLSAEGFQVFLSPNVREGLRAIKTHHMDLVISDLLVKYMDAYDFCQSARQLSDGKVIPFLFVVQSDDDLRKAKVDRLEKCACVRKGSSVGEVIRMIHQVMSHEDHSGTPMFTLPVQPADVSSGSPRHAAAKPPLVEQEDHFDARILVVDDDDNFRSVLESMLADEGYTNITTAVDGDKAIALLQKNPYELILLDIIMPTVSGFGVLKFIKENAISTRVIMVTAYADLKLAVEAKKNGAADFIAKPFMRDDLFGTIKKVLNQPL